MSSREFREFQSLDPVSPPRSATDRIIQQVRRDLHPSAWEVFSKLSFLHFFVALFTLSLCPQFGVRVLGHGMGLMRYFMDLGDLGCGVMCGVIFLSLSPLLASFLLRPEEVRTIRENRLLELGGLALLSLGVFVMIHAEIAVGFAIAWVLGSVAGAWATLEIGWSLRLKTAGAGSKRAS